MIVKVDMYAAECDVCKTHCEYGDFSCYGDKDMAREEAQESEWHFEDNGLCYCPDCFTIDENDDLVLKPIK